MKASEDDRSAGKEWQLPASGDADKAADIVRWTYIKTAALVLVWVAMVSCSCFIQ